MTDTTQSLLVDELVARYDDFKRRLTVRLGSAELASEALQDTFLRLRSATILDQVQSPRAYLLRTALNIAINRVLSEKRRMTAAEVDAMVEIPDDAPDPTRVVEGRSDIAALKRALAELPPRRREIVLAAAFNDVPYSVLAARFGVTVRTIQIEMKHALAHCAQRLDRPSAMLMKHSRLIRDNHLPVKRRARSARATANT
ncbi:MAG TPA: RNA polymerase sigma factor [Rhodopseudomonas sp.]|uniref:RNA polymerase sigma factor n=1 Tax=Rhodopseudomonas sp. TaxID=1078 RepID=UPI002ED8F0CD